MKSNEFELMDPDHDPRIAIIRMERMINLGLVSDSRLIKEYFKIMTTRMYSCAPIENKAEDYCYDPARDYKQNAAGYRGIDVHSQVDLIAIGCSQTFGLGIPEEAMWSKTMANALDMSYATLAAPGWSVQEMTSTAMAYIAKYGKPKVIAALLPDFGRTVMVEDTALFVERGDGTAGTWSPLRVRGFKFGAEPPLPKLSKAPHVANEVIPPEFAVYLSAQTWSNFIEYCNVADIKLVWTTWSESVTEKYSILEEYLADKTLNNEDYRFDFSGYVPNPLRHTEGQWIKQLAALECHGDVEALEPGSFHVGTDKCQHYGTHAHAHIAEMLEARYRELSPSE